MLEDGGVQSFSRNAAVKRNYDRIARRCSTLEMIPEVERYMRVILVDDYEHRIRWVFRAEMKSEVTDPSFDSHVYVPVRS